METGRLSALLAARGLDAAGSKSERLERLAASYSEESTTTRRSTARRASGSAGRRTVRIRSASRRWSLARRERRGRQGVARGAADQSTLPLTLVMLRRRRPERRIRPALGPRRAPAASPVAQRPSGATRPMARRSRSQRPVQ